MTQQRFTVNTKHGTFASNLEYAKFVLLYKNRIPSAKIQTEWVASENSAKRQEKRLKSLGYLTLGIYQSTEQVSTSIPQETELADESATEQDA
ncbi:hypothetical protein [Pseudoalteromonas umbrosa]|uniref:hypothetical protein n=1 Tax=Pseudoalteromonas umbrosa TaxID=3048489 RepID=UPI0024C34FFE|nr:hypothetical protein [Pseudoalteromonas sp. B95]MDK1290207.1 hypothetical protein [Pseudoalteromonas sp. B95]